MDIHAILKQYWGYDSFRPLQEDIIRSVLEGNDTLALLPTGGGKSICFQVPVLAQEGIGIVVSPLIALMKDQVQNLQKRGIKAIAIYSGMSKREIDIALDNCAYGNIKFLYVSPERLETSLFKARVQKMNVNLLAIDESHCISQWGYDFRPSYLNIKKIKELLPNVPTLALTATATPEVVDDIQKQLAFKNGRVFQKSFARKNLAYIVLKEENKYNRLEKILNKIPGTSVVYVRNRRRTKEVAAELIKRGISADYYHAGLSMEERNQKQNNWINNHTRVIISTNAFGMGIDKPDVRSVVHLDLPDTLEAYFQEAGRGGRDEKKAYAVVLWEDADIRNLKQQTEAAFPPIETIKRVYQAIGNYLQIPDNSALNETYEIDFFELSRKFNLSLPEIFHAIKFLEKENYLAFSDAVYQPTRIKFTVDRRTLYNLQVKHPFVDKLVKIILRLHGGAFENFVKINEKLIARQLNVSEHKIVKALKFLHKADSIDYLPATNKPTVTYTREKTPLSHFYISSENYHFLKKRAFEKMQKVIDYVTTDYRCRSVMLLEYFGEKEAENCGVCDVCLAHKQQINATQMEELSTQILKLLEPQPLSFNDLLKALPQQKENHLNQALRWLMENNKITTDSDMNYQIKNKQ